MIKKTRPEPYSNEEITYLTQHYADTYTSVLADYLGRSKQSVYDKAKKLGLKKSDSFMRMELQRQGSLLKISGACTRFAGGYINNTKGRKMTPKQRQKIEHTFFKKGSIPHNIKGLGHERICKNQGYVMINIGKRNYALKHRLIWEQHFGPVPEGMIIAFKDHNKLNVTLENLELVSKKEFMARYSISNYPPELRETIKLVKKVKRKIGEIENANKK